MCFTVTNCTETSQNIYVYIYEYSVLFILNIDA